jgi:DNA-binding MarR family transcriptional regulator
MPPSHATPTDASPVAQGNPPNKSKRLQKGPLVDVLGYLLANASIHTNRVFEERVHKPLKLRKVEYTILNLVDQNPGIKANKVAKALGFSAANTSVWLEKMCDKQLLQREPDPVDKRAMHLFITESGRQLCEAATAGILQGEQETLKHLSPAEQAMLKELLKKYAAGRPHPPSE